jgi:hypothetical protein
MFRGVRRHQRRLYDQIANLLFSFYNTRMLSNRNPLILALIVSIYLMSGCSGRPAPGSNNAASNADAQNANRAVEPGMEGAKDNAEELGTLVRMPYEPEDLAWKEYSTPQGRRLLAVFQLTDEDSRKLIEAASKARPGSSVSIASEKWFPKELVTQNEMSGDTGIQATSYAADEFLQPPFSEGTVSRVDNTNFFVLEAFAR